MVSAAATYSSCNHRGTPFASSYEERSWTGPNVSNRYTNSILASLTCDDDPQKAMLREIDNKATHSKYVET